MRSPPFGSLMVKTTTPTNARRCPDRTNTACRHACRRQYNAGGSSSALGVVEGSLVFTGSNLSEACKGYGCPAAIAEVSLT